MLFKHIRNPKVLKEAQKQGVVSETGYVNCKGLMEYQVLDKKQLTDLFKGRGWECVNEKITLSTITHGPVEIHYMYSNVNQTVNVRAFNEIGGEIPFFRGSIFNACVLHHSRLYWQQKTELEILKMAARHFRATWEPCILMPMYDNKAFKFQHYCLSKQKTILYPFERGIGETLTRWLSNHPRVPQEGEIAIITHKGKKFAVKVI